MGCKRTPVWKSVQRNMKRYFLGLLFLCLIGAYSSSSVLTVSEQDLSFLTKENSSFILSRGPDDDSGADTIEISFNFTNGNAENLLEPIAPVKIAPNTNITITIVPLQAGHVDIVAVAPSNITDSGSDKCDNWVGLFCCLVSLLLPANCGQFQTEKRYRIKFRFSRSEHCGFLALRLL